MKIYVIYVVLLVCGIYCGSNLIACNPLIKDRPDPIDYSHLDKKVDMPKLPKPKPKPMTETPSYLGGKPGVEGKGKVGLFSGKDSTTNKKSKMWLTIRTYISSEGREDPYCDVWIIKRDGAVLQGVLHGYILQETAEQLATSSSLPVKYEVTDFSPKRNAINQPIDPTPFEDLDELEE